MSSDKRRQGVLSQPPQHMATLTEETLRRRFLVLTAFRWFPGGLVLPVLVLLMQARGLALATIGVLFAAFSALVALLDVPTGGLADILGRRRIALASALLTAAAFAVLAVARGATSTGAALAVLALGRAMSTGPLQAWYVDAVQGLNPHIDLQPALAREGLVNSAATGLGILAGGLIPRLVTHFCPGVHASGSAAILSLSVPLLAASTLLIVASLAIALLMKERAAGPPATSKSSQPLHLLPQGVPRRIADSAELVRRDQGLRAILLSVAATGCVVSAVEVLAPSYFALLLHNSARSATLYSGLLTSVFFASALGSASAPRLAKLSRSPVRAATMALLVAAVFLTGLANLSGLVLASLCFILVYLAFGVLEPLRLEQLHLRAQERERTTLLSVESTAQMLGAVAGALLVPRIASSYGFRAGWFACVLVVLLAGFSVAKIGIGRPYLRSQLKDDQAEEAALPTENSPGGQLNEDGSSSCIPVAAVTRAWPTVP